LTAEGHLFFRRSSVE